MRKAAYILLLISTLAICSCGKEPVCGGEGSGFGSLSLRLDSGSAVRLETKAEPEDLEDGLRFNNVLVILTNSSDKVVGSVYKTYPYVPGSGDIQDAEAASSVTEDVIHFEQLLPGNYNIYAYANIDAAAWQNSGAMISAQEKALSPGADFSAFLNRELASLTGTDVPSDPAVSMLLTGTEAGVPVGLGTAEASIDLLRPVVRFKVTVRNHTSYPVTVDGLSFSKFNPDRAYLLGHADESGVPSVPAGVNYRSLPDYPILSASPATVAGEDESVVYQTLLYENTNTSAYKVFASMTMDRSAESLSDLSLTLGARAFGVIDYATLEEMDDGESVDVLLINPRKQTRSARLYYGIGTDNQLAWESCGYDSYDKLFARARAIYTEEVSHVYQDFTYTGAANTQSGLAGWTGNTDDAYLTSNSGDTGDGITFDYTGAKSTYFRTLTKSDGLYTIEGLAVDPIAATSIAGLKIQQGAKTTGDRFAADLPESYLVNFINSSNTGQHLKSDCQYNESTPDKAKKSRLMWENASSNTQDHQFILFGQYSGGGKLKRIVKKTHKEVPLTYMTRNEDINVIINVYYADQEGEITFVVDNSTWTDDAATTSSHTFN